MYTWEAPFTNLSKISMHICSNNLLMRERLKMMLNFIREYFQTCMVMKHIDLDDERVCSSIFMHTGIQSDRWTSFYTARAFGCNHIQLTHACRHESSGSDKMKTTIPLFKCGRLVLTNMCTQWCHYWVSLFLILIYQNNTMKYTAILKSEKLRSCMELQAHTTVASNLHGVTNQKYAPLKITTIVVFSVVKSWNIWTIYICM